MLGVEQKGTIAHLYPQPPQFLRKSYYHLSVGREIKRGCFPLDWYRPFNSSRRENKVQIFLKISAEVFSSQSLAPFLLAAEKQIEIDLALNRIPKKNINWSHLLYILCGMNLMSSTLNQDLIESLLLPGLSRNKIKGNNLVTVSILQQAVVLKIECA